MKSRNRVLMLVVLWMVGWAAFGATEAGASTGPYFQYFSVFAYNTSTEMKTALDVTIVDPDGTVPDTIASLAVTGPNGFAYTFAPEDYLGGTTNEYWKTLSGLPADGEYTFTATDVDGNTAITYFQLTVAGIIPLPDPSTYRASGANLLTPTLSWSAIPGYPGKLYYRAKVLTMDDQDVWSSSRAYNLTSVTVPGGVLAEGQSYKWRVDAFDDFSLQVMSTRATADPIPLTLTNTHPYFISVAAFAQHNPDGSVSTGLHARGADPAGSVSSVVVTEPNSAKHTYSGSALSCLNTSNGCSWNVSTAPVAGQYTFEVTNAANNTAVSYFYLDPYTVPLLDTDTMHASGNALTPVLSWSTPAATDRPLYYVVMVRNAATQAMVWSSWTVQNAISVPQGNLAAGVSYEWQVAPNDSSDFSFSNRSFSGWKSLTVDNSSPYFWYVTLFDRSQPNGNFMALDVSVRDGNGACPGNLTSLTVTGPGGFSYSFKPEDYYPPDNTLYHRFPGATPDGLYTIISTDNTGTSAVTYKYHRQAGGTIPLLDEDSFRLFGDPLAPTISWSAVSGYPHDLYYFLQIVDSQDNQVYGSSTPIPPTTYQVVPSGRLVAGPSYRYRVNAYDARFGATADNRVVSAYHYFGVPSIAGQVTNSLGSGLANISVQAYNAVTGASTPTILTDQEGNYQFSNLPTGNYKILFSGTGYFSQWYSGKANQASADPVVVTAPALTSGIDVVLEPSGGISGSVTNDLGVGIANVNVQVCEPGGYMLAYAMTNSSGNYTVSGLPAGNYKVRFLASQGYRSEWYNDKSTQNSADLVAVTLPDITPGINAVLGPGASISGTVRNGQGTGIANVDIWVYDLNGWWMSGARTNQNGVYAANGLPGGSYRVLFTPPSATGYSSEWYNNKSQQNSADPVAVTVPNVTSGIDAVLELGGSISGTVTNSLGAGIANVQVQVYDAADTDVSSSKGTVTTGQDGSYTLSGLPSGSYKLFFSAVGYFSEWYDGKTSQAAANPVAVTAPAPTSGVDVVLEQSGGISGTVRNTTGSGIANVWVGVSHPDGSYATGAPTNQDGSYTVSGLPTGSYMVRFNAPSGYLSEWYDGKLTQDAATLVAVALPNLTSGIDAVLEPGGSISGTVTNELGTGMASVNVQVFGLDGMWAAGVMTNQNGVYTASGLPSGTFGVFFSPPAESGYSSEWYNHKVDQGSADPVVVTVPNTTSGIDAVLEQGGKISGTVKNQAGKGIANAQVQVYDAAYMGMGMPRATVTTTAKGGYTVMGLPAGTYKVFFQAGGYYSEWYNNKAGQDIADVVTVTAPNTTSTINVVLNRSGGITGTVKNASGAGIQNVWVGISSLDGAYLQSTPTDQSGKYTVSGLPSGTYKVNFNAPKGYRSEWYNNKKTFDTATPVTVTEPKITSGINAVLDPGGSIAGTVANEEGAGIANVDVQVVDLTGQWRSGARTGPNGSYTANGLAAGSYRVSFTPPAGNGYSIEWYDNKASQDSATNVPVAVSSTTTGIDAVLQQGGIVTVTSPNGGENWKVGTKWTIKWKYAGDIGENVKIELLRGDTVVKTIAPNAASSTGSFIWKVPTALAYGDNYRIAVTGNAAISRTDLSDNSFAISGPTLDVTSPDGGESWRRGTPHDITWTYTGNPGGMVKIQLLKGGGILGTLTSACPIGTSGQGSFSWTVQQNLQVAANYQIKITHTVIAGCTGTSDSPFGIAKALAAVSAGPDQKVAEAETVRLSGANSSGFDKQKATFSWTQLDGPQTRLSHRTTLEPRLTAPEIATENASLMFLLTIIGEDGSQAQDSCIVNVSETNVPPTAAAGHTQTVAGGSLVVLDGSASFDPDDEIVSYAWKQIAGPQITLSDPTREQTTFTTPDLDLDGDVLLFELIVTDQGGLRARDTCIVNVTGTSQPPVANAGGNLAVRPGSRVMLDGSRSCDPDGMIVSYRWTQLTGQPVTLSDPEAMRPSFILPSNSDIGNELVFQLTVTDNAGLQDKSRVAATIVEAPLEDMP